MDRPHAIRTRHLVHPLGHFTIRAPRQLHEASECLGDLEERILNLVQARASMCMRVMKLDDCPHSSAPVLLDFLGSLRLAASYPPRGRLGSPATDYDAIRRKLPQDGDNLLSSIWAIFARLWDICTRTTVLRPDSCQAQLSLEVDGERVTAALARTGSSLPHPLAEVVHQFLESGSFGQRLAL